MASLRCWSFQPYRRIIYCCHLFLSASAQLGNNFYWNSQAFYPGRSCIEVDVVCIYNERVFENNWNSNKYSPFSPTPSSCFPNKALEIFRFIAKKVSWLDFASFRTGKRKKKSLEMTTFERISWCDYDFLDGKTWKWKQQQKIALNDQEKLIPAKPKREIFHILLHNVKLNIFEGWKLLFTHHHQHPHIQIRDSSVRWLCIFCHSKFPPRLLLALLLWNSRPNRQEKQI